MSRHVQRCLLVLAGLLVLGCGVATEPAEETTSRRDPVLERFWENFRGASAARRDGDLERAASLYELALADDPDHGDTLYYLGNFRYARGETAAALAHFEHLAEVEPGGLRSWQQLSLARGQGRSGWVGGRAGAEVAARRALELVRTDSLNYELLARWAAYAGEGEASRGHIATALGHNQTSEAARRLQEWIEASSEQPSRTDVSAIATDASDAAYEIDLDGDRATDLIALRVDGARPVLLAETASGRRVLPDAGRVPGWEGAAEHSGEGPFPVPTGAALIAGPYGERVVLVGGGGRGARVYEAESGIYQEIDTGDLPAPAGAPLIAAADFDEDGVDDVVIGNIRLSADSQALGARVFIGQAGGSLVASDIEFAGPLVQLMTVDIDGDGDADIVVGRAGHSAAEDEAAGDHAPPVAAAERTVVAVFLNENGRFTPASVDTPFLGGDVRDIVATDFDGDGRLDLFFATGAWTPERSVPDVLWRATSTGFVDASERLGANKTGATFRAWPAAGGLVLVRGGAVAGAPRYSILLSLR